MRAPWGPCSISNRTGVRPDDHSSIFSGRGAGGGRCRASVGGPAPRGSAYPLHPAACRARPRPWRGRSRRYRRGRHAGEAHRAGRGAGTAAAAGGGWPRPGGAHPRPRCVRAAGRAGRHRAATGGCVVSLHPCRQRAGWPGASPRGEHIHPGRNRLRPFLGRAGQAREPGRPGRRPSPALGLPRGAANTAQPDARRNPAGQRATGATDHAGHARRPATADQPAPPRRLRRIEGARRALRAGRDRLPVASGG